MAAEFVVRNAGHLVLNGFDGSEDRTRLDLKGGMLVDASTVTPGARTVIELNSTGESENVVLRNATVYLDADATFLSPFTTFDGTSTVTTTETILGNSGPSFRSAVALEDSGTLVNVRGSGDFYSEALFLRGGTLDIGMDPFTDGDFTAAGVSQGKGPINVATGNRLLILGDFEMSAADGALDNDGTILVRSGGRFSATGPVGGRVVVEAGSELRSNLSGCDFNRLDLGLASELHMGINPSTAGAGSISVDELVLDSPVDSIAPVLVLRIVTDAALPVGQKILLVDYETISPGSGGGGSVLRFRGFPDGHVFQLGMNTYQVRYEDPEYSATNSSVITLTAVDSPYEAWMSGYPGVPVDQRGPADDPDGDGCANFFEFAHKGDPTDPGDKGLMCGLIQDASAPVGDEFTLVIALPDGAGFFPGPNGVRLLLGNCFSSMGSDSPHC